MIIDRIEKGKEMKKSVKHYLSHYLEFLVKDEYNNEEKIHDVQNMLIYLGGAIFMDSDIISVLTKVFSNVDPEKYDDLLNGDERQVLDQLLRDLDLMPKLERINIINSENAENDEIFIKKILNNLKDLLPEIMNDDKESKRKAEYISHELESGAYKLVRIHRELDRS